MRKLISACGTTLTATRDPALFLIDFAGALHRSELVGMNVSDITWAEDGLVLVITRSKTDVEAIGARIRISRGRAVETCPVIALHAWPSEARITDGPVFRKVNRGGTVEQSRLTAGAVRQLLVHRASQAGIPSTWPEPASTGGLRGRLCDSRLSQRCALRGDHGPYTPSKLHFDADPRATGKTRRRAPVWESWPLMQIMSSMLHGGPASWSEVDACFYIAIGSWSWTDAA